MEYTSVSALLHDLADAEVDLEPFLAADELKEEQRRNLHEVHGEERNWVVSVKERVRALGHL